METLCKISALLSCLLSIGSVAHSDLSKEEQFNLLSHYNNASLVEDSLKLVSSSSGLAVSTLINYGFWYGICRSPELVSTLTGRSGLSGTQQNELQEVKSSFCNQLAAVITSTEVALVGHVSPYWSLRRPLWQPLRYVGTGFVGFRAYTTDDPYFIPITIAYFTHEVMARTVAEAETIKDLRDRDIRSIKPEKITLLEYAILKSITGLMVGAIVYERLAARGSTLNAIFAYVLSNLMAHSVMSKIYMSTYNSDDAHAVEVEAGAKALTATKELAGTRAVATIGAIGAVAFWISDPVLSVIAFYTLAFSLGKIETSIPHSGDCGSTVGAVVMFLLSSQKSNLDSNHLLKNVAFTLVPALTIALINGVSNNAVYGYSLEESFTETVRNQWQKLYAPLDYLHTLFN
ncbi:hypothetical protein [Endozoicomonas sp. ALC020]|uniref:hypothetical protein n=1 Tax=unclassified Endozoicomonas TaxID=2644528 RepID=UPI003BB065B0